MKPIAPASGRPSIVMLGPAPLPRFRIASRLADDKPVVVVLLQRRAGQPGPDVHAVRRRT